MIRYLQPSVVMELGAGYSTWIAASACAENRLYGVNSHIISVDPEPRIELPSHFEANRTLYRLPLQKIPVDMFQALGKNDIVFVDTSHSVKKGSDVNHIVLEVLPKLNRDVFVHFHDIFLPWDYPKQWFQRGTFLTEQYLLQAYLVENTRYEVMLGLYALSRIDPDGFKHLVPDFTPYFHGPSAFWLRS